MTIRLCIVCLCLLVALGGMAAWAPAQETTSAKLKFANGREIYQAACVACHGPDGKGMPDTTVAFEKPSTFPDFTRCDQTTPELNKDWKATVRDGGAGRGFSCIMPSFGEALTSKQIDEVVRYLRGFCTDKKWPRGEFNLPLAQFTEKAFPEDEVIITSRLNAQRTPGVTNDIISENTFGARSQLEVDAPINFVRAAPGLWHGGIGDATIGLKQVIFANLDRGSILSGFGGIIVPSGSTTHGLGSGVTQFETFAAFAQILPGESFVQLQAGTDEPADPAKAPRSLFWRSAFGKTFRQQNGLGRMWTPMVEVVANKDFLPHTTPDWDIVPQFQVNDPAFTGGGHRVRYSAPVGTATGPFTVEAELWYQPIGYRWANNLKPYDSAAEPQRFNNYFDSMKASTATVLARATFIRLQKNGERVGGVRNADSLAQ